MNQTPSKLTDIQNPALRDIASERRQAMQVVQYWDHLRGDRPMPEEDDLDVDDVMIAHLWDHCFVVQLRDVDLGIPEFNYTYLGPAIIGAYGEELAGVEVDHMVSLNASKLTSAYQEVVKTMRPVIHSGEHDGHAGGMVKFRQVLLPISRGTDKVEVILGYLNYQIHNQ